MISNLETIFCAFPAENSFVNALIPLKGVLNRVPFIGVKILNKINMTAIFGEIRQ